jgi:purine nucleosidase
MERLIIDTDPGVDDAQAFLMASAHSGVKIEALLAVGGNVGLEHTLRNSLLFTEIVDQDIPVYAGCDKPLVMFQEDAAFSHGEDGLGDAGLTPQHRTAEREHGALALIRMVNESPGDFTLAAIGPLTNIALALKFDPELPHKLKRFVIMGGAVTGDGNTSSIKAEFNIYYDPEAAHIVFEAWGRAGLQIEVIDWEITKRHGFDRATFEAWRNIDTKRGKFFRAITEKQIHRTFTLLKRPTVFAADPLALAVLLEPEIVTRRESHHLAVELIGTHTRGQTVVDWGDRSGQPINADIIMEVDQARFEALMEQGLR